MSDAAPWIALAGLGVFHGLNPAMGWLFAVALGVYRQRRSAVLLAIIPISLGHLLSVALVAGAFVAAGAVVDAGRLQQLAGLVLIAWAIWYWLFGHRQRVRFGMTVGALGLAAWSFSMATMHGAGLMLIPALQPICSATTGFGSAGAAPFILGAVLVHFAAMVTVAGLVAMLVYEWVGLAILRTHWINIDFVWAIALCGVGAILVFG
jgi:hypothetical protein